MNKLEKKLCKNLNFNLIYFFLFQNLMTFRHFHDTKKHIT